MRAEKGCWSGGSLNLELLVDCALFPPSWVKEHLRILFVILYAKPRRTFDSLRISLLSSLTGHDDVRLSCMSYAHFLSTLPFFHLFDTNIGQGHNKP